MALFSNEEEIGAAQAKLQYIAPSKLSTCTTLSTWRVADLSSITSDGSIPTMFEGVEVRHDDVQPNTYSDDDSEVDMDVEDDP